MRRIYITRKTKIILYSSRDNSNTIRFTVVILCHLFSGLSFGEPFRTSHLKLLASVGGQGFCFSAGPSAVQVELGSEHSPYCLSLLGPPVGTTGCSKIRVPTDGFQRPVQLVRLETSAEEHFPISYHSFR